MKRRATLETALTLATAMVLVGCGPSYRMTAPTGFVKYEETSEFKYITADGVRLKAREVDNYPKGDLAFWTDALKRHLDRRGYALRAEDCFQTRAGLRGCTVDFVAPTGDAEDWFLSATVFVVDDRVVLLEAAGPASRYSGAQPSLRAAFETFEPGT